MKKNLLIVFLVFLNAALVVGQGKLLQANELMLFTFKTKSGKTCIIAHEKTNEAYLVYRFGTDTSLELEFPKKKKDAWSKFTYQFYYRGGGKQNVGLDLNYLTFTNGGYQYMIYQTYSAEDDSSDCGIEVKNLSTEKKTVIQGVYSTSQGGLNLLRDSIHIDEIER